MTFNVSDFTSNLINDGARPNLFQVTMATLPAALGGNGTNSANAPARRLSFMARAAQIPGSSVGVIPMFYFGREIKLAGNRTFPEWTITIINDEDFSIRNSMETWMNYINSHTGNLRGQGNAPGTGSAARGQAPPRASPTCSPWTVSALACTVPSWPSGMPSRSCSGSGRRYAARQGGRVPARTGRTSAAGFARPEMRHGPQ